MESAEWNPHFKIVRNKDEYVKVSRNRKEKMQDPRFHCNQSMKLINFRCILHERIKSSHDFAFLDSWFRTVSPWANGSLNDRKALFRDKRIYSSSCTSSRDKCKNPKDARVNVETTYVFCEGTEFSFIPIQFISVLLIILHLYYQYLSDTATPKWRDYLSSIANMITSWPSTEVVDLAIDSISRSQTWKRTRTAGFGKREKALDGLSLKRSSFPPPHIVVVSWI